MTTPLEEYELARDALVKRLSSRNFLLRMLYKRIFEGKESAVAEAEKAAAGILPLEKRQSVPRSTPPDGVGIYGFFNAESGIGQSARRSALSFRANGFPTSCHSIEASTVFKDKVPFETSQDPVTPYDTVLIHANPDSLRYVASELPSIPRSRKRIGYWAWELPVFPARWAAAFDLVDEVWAPSAFSAAAIATGTDKAVRVVPHAIPGVKIDRDIARKALKIHADELVILAIFDANSYAARKNPVGMIRAFIDAFPAGMKDAPRFIVKTHGSTQRNHVFEEFRALAAGDSRVTVIDKVYTPEQVVLLQNACDVFLSLHRSEGYGLNIAECMAVGKLAIATNFSGNVDFMNSGNSLPIPYSMKPVQPGEYLLGEGQWWAEPDHEAAVEALRLAFKRSSVTQELAGKGMADIGHTSSFERIGRVAIAALNGQTLEPEPRSASR